MAKTRYAIVKVNNHCPSRFVDNVRNEYVCKTKQTKDGYHLNCIGCRYGDTKEQLIRKVAQVLFRKEIRLYKKFWGGNMSNIVKKNQYKWCLETAEEIVEFLGVE